MKKDELKKIFTPDMYEVKLFSELGHTRKSCVKCGTNFWTLDPDRQTCGDTPCEGGYHFIGEQGVNWDFHETIKQLTDFFSKHGHTPIDPYPTVARWRDDLEFTIASIADFQPWVTNGSIPPPANPLTVPQPVVRFGGEFSDIDNVGRTGRHLTSFIMFGQHAFNSDTITDGYWMDRCIDLNYKFLTENMKLKPEEITYLEGIWMGGGNFGPNLESFSRGTEIVNSVFMQYQNTPNGYKEMDLRVIDVGWGLERVSWFTQGTPTIYEATFGPVHEWLVKETGIKIDNDLLTNYSKLAGLIDVNEISDVKSARTGIAEQLGFTLNELNQKLMGVEGLYALGDHSRTVAWTLSDGALPSNVGGGYNLRTMIRKMFTIKDMLELELDLLELIERSATYVSKSFPRIKDAIEFSKVIFDVEKVRFDKTLESGKKHVKKMMKGKKKIDETILVDLYRSRGIPPETVASIAKDMGQEISIPMDFYQKVDAVAETTNDTVVAEEEMDLETIKDFQTIPLYYTDTFLQSCEAKVEAILDTDHIVFDQTVFYPLGGGQAEDHGIMRFGKQEINIVDVKKFGTAVVHKMDKKPKNIKVGSKVHLEIDMERRLQLMRHHTAVHIVNGAAKKVLGDHVWQAGANKTIHSARLDITHFESIDRKTLDEIEKVANDIVQNNTVVNKPVMQRSEAEQEHGFTIYQGGVVPGKDLRIVDIPGHDTEACGGTHADRTGDIGYIRLLGAERIQDGIVRLSIHAGRTAVNRSQYEHDLLAKAANTFSVPIDEVPKTAERFFSEWKEQRKLIDKLSKQLAEAKVPNLIAAADEITTKKGTELRLVVTEMNAPQSDLLNLGQQFSSQSKDLENLVAVIVGQHEGRAMVVLARSKGSKLDLSPAMRSIAKIVGGGGGGRKDVIAGGGTKVDMIANALEQAKSLVIENL